MKKITKLISAGALALSIGAGLMTALEHSNFIEVKADITTNQLWVGGVDITTQPNMKIGDDTNYAQLVNNVLTLHDYSFSGRGGLCESSSKFAGIYYKGTTDLTIKLEGHSSITVVGEDDESRPKGGDYLYGLYSIQYSASITFIGDGTLDLFSNPVKYKTVGLASGLRFGGERNAASVTVDGPTVNLSCGDSVLQSFALYFNNTSNPQNGNGSLNIVSGSLTATGGSAYKQYDWDEKDGKSYGIVGISDINVSGGSLTGIGGYGALSAGLCFGYPNGGKTETDFTGGNISFSADDTSDESYGIYEGFVNEFSYNLTSGVNSFESSGKTCAQKSHIKVINEISGWGYDNVAGTGTGEKISVSSTGQSLSSDYKKVIFAKLPNSYVTEPSAKAGLKYTGSAQELVNAGTPTGGTMLYKLETGEYSENVPTATDVGDYTVYYKVNGGNEYQNIEERHVDVSIAKGDSAYGIEPTAVTDLKYTGSAQTLVNAGSSSTGTVVYRLGTSGEFVNELPTATDSGTYAVYYKIIGDANHEDSAESHFDVTIAKADSYISEPSASANLVYTGVAQALVSAGEIVEGEILYKVNDGEYSSNIPTATDAGSYTVYYKVNEGTNHAAIAEKSIVVNIGKASWGYSSEPSAKAGLKYTGSAQTLIDAGTSTGGAILYKVNDGEYSSSVPTAVASGTYTVYYKIDGDANHNGVAEKSFTVTIEKSYVFDSFVWASDNKSAQAKFYSEEDATDTKLENAVMTSEVLSSPTCTVSGTTRYTATYGEHSESKDVVVVALGHTPAEAVRENVVEPTCTEAGSHDEVVYCSICHEELSRTHIVDEAHGHDLIHHEHVDATTKKEGNIEYWECSRCGKLYLDPVGEEETTAEAVVIPKLVATSAKLPGWGIALIIIGVLLLSLCLAYFLLFFVFNKWIKKDNNALRVIKVGKKDDKVRLLTMLFKVELRDENEVFNSKEEALK